MDLCIIKRPQNTAVLDTGLIKTLDSSLLLLSASALNDQTPDITLLLLTASALSDQTSDSTPLFTNS